MNKKYISLLLIPLLLSSCGGRVSLEYEPFNEYLNKKETHCDVDNDLYYQRKDINPISYIGGTISSFRELHNYQQENRSHLTLPNIGDVKLLVLPISFSNSDSSSLKDKTIYIQNAFFGSDKHNGYYSVASYYNKSSYGHIKLSGEVAPWFNAQIKYQDWKQIDPDYKVASRHLVAQALEQLRNNTSIDLSSYDTDNDGFIDGIYAIYDAPYANENNAETIFWAYTDYLRVGEASVNNDAPYGNVYGWSSVDFLIGKNNVSESKTIIHETGHLFGLSDYYNTYSPESGYHYQPTGFFDMMDYNLGDHSAFSKYLLDLTSPRVIKKGAKGTLTLSSFTESGDCLLIPSSSYSDNPFGEYLLVEYFTPSGLNVDSSKNSYPYTNGFGEEKIFAYPNHHGLKISHIDARLAYFDKKIYRNQKLCLIDNPQASEIIKDKNVFVGFAYSNSISDSLAKNNEPVLNHLLESNGENSFINGNGASNETLFRYDDDFGITVFKDYPFHSGGTSSFSLKVLKITSKDITIEIQN